MVGTPPIEAPQGLRARKKQRTRELIAETARSLFGERGFERVTVAEIARAAEVSEQTVFNYFPSKEDLVFWRFEYFEQELLAAIREREPGESTLAAFGRFVRRRRGVLAKQEGLEARERLAAISRMIAESSALLAREQQIFERYTASLAAFVAADLGADAGDITPWVAANAMMGVHRALIDVARRRIVQGESHARIAREVDAQAAQALGMLDRGLGGYLVKRKARRR